MIKFYSVAEIVPDFFIFSFCNLAFWFIANVPSHVGCRDEFFTVFAIDFDTHYFTLKMNAVIGEGSLHGSLVSPCNHRILPIDRSSAPASSMRFT